MTGFGHPDRKPKGIYYDQDGCAATLYFKLVALDFFEFFDILLEVCRVEFPAGAFFFLLPGHQKLTLLHVPIEILHLIKL